MDNIDIISQVMTLGGKVHPVVGIAAATVMTIILSLMGIKVKKKKYQKRKDSITNTGKEQQIASDIRNELED